ncbi:MAG: hypothetical protein JW731_12935 [Bacteroidales bacterium]|nr:hypothetical protein [Bacteroidales bacterium]
MLTSVWLLTSCYPEWKLSRAYIESKPDISILLLPVNFVFKSNLKVIEIGDTTGLTPFERDSLLMAKSIFLKDISDSIFLTTFINGMIEEFEALGFKVYLENLTDSFLFLQSPAYIFNIAQLQLEEHYSEFEDEAEYGDYVYHKKLDLNAITYNSWFEMNELNDPKSARKLFFSSETITDQITGYFTENLITGEVEYKYFESEIDLDIIYHYAGVFARRYAGYAFDYILNEHLNENWPPDKQRRFYMRYNRSNNTLDPAGDERFIEIEE